jgi:hypothetical protein
MVIERKWEDAIHLKHKFFEDFWKQRLEQKRDILVICGLGWDPRMTILLSVLKDFGGRGLRHLHLINYRPYPSFESTYKKFIEKNVEEKKRLCAHWMIEKEISIITRKEDNRYAGDDEISRSYTGCDISQYSEIQVDISALPKSLYFPLLQVLVKKCKKSNNGINLHVIACQDVSLDNQIIESIDDLRFFKGFAGKLRSVTHKNLPKIWVPILTGNSKIVLQKLHEYLQPKDIYPVLPFPSRNIRTDDDLLMEYHNIFVDEWNLNPLNIIYAAEDDPLDIYRSLMNLYDQQMEALSPLGGISMVFSCLSSKISSIGAFMAAFEKEKEIAVAHAIGRHELKNISDLYWSDEYKNRFKENLHSIWLTGEPYE